MDCEVVVDESINYDTIQFTATDYTIEVGSWAVYRPAETARLLMDSGWAATIGCVIDGWYGPVKDGEGTLILSGTNAYSGGTTIDAGVLVAATTAALPGYDSSGMVAVAAGAAVGGCVGGTYGWSETDFKTLQTYADWTAGASLTIDTTNGDYTYTSSLVDPNYYSIGLTKLGPDTLRP